MSEHATSEFHRAFIEDGEMLFAALRLDGTSAFASPFLLELLGRRPEEVVGGNVLDWVHPHDLDRAIYQLGAAEDSSPAPGLSRFEVLHADGTYRPIEIMATALSIGDEQMLGLYIRSGSHQGFIIQRVLEMLLEGTPCAEALDPVCDVVQWQRLGSRVAVSWCDDVGFHQVGRRLPESLGGGDGATGTPWQRSRDEEVEIHGDLNDLDDARRQRSRGSGDRAVLDRLCRLVRQVPASHDHRMDGDRRAFADRPQLRRPGADEHRRADPALDRASA